MEEVRVRCGYLLVMVACGGTDPPDPQPQPLPVPAPPPVQPAPAAAGAHPCAPGEGDRVGEWRYALTGGMYERTLDVTRDQLVVAWRAGKIAASADVRAALAPALGAPGRERAEWTIVPAHELAPAQTVITVEHRHPLASVDGPLVVAMCGGGAPVHNIDPAKLTTLVMSGTTAMTGRLARRIDEDGVRDTVRYIQPFFASADLVHISNEVSFVRHCDPLAGQEELKFCSRDSYIEVLEALHAKIIELTGSHLIDHGHHPLLRTIDAYQRRGWIWFGGGRTQLDATTPRIVEHHGNKLAFVGCNAVAAWVRAVGQGPGVAACDLARVVWQVQDLRRRGLLPIVSVQHQETHIHDVPPKLVSDLRRLAEAGAAFVMGSQAHSAHPWDIHYGAYVHYGPGNILFAQDREAQREATVDKLYFHDGRLLSVEHLFTRIEHGRPRLLSDDERARFLAEIVRVEGNVPPPEPAGTPALPAEDRTRPDSVVIKGRNQYLLVTAPERVTPGTRYPLVVDLKGTAQRDDAYVVTPKGKSRATGKDIARFMRKKYPIDPRKISVRRHQ